MKDANSRGSPVGQKVQKGKQKIRGFRNRLANKLATSKKKQSFGYLMLQMLMRVFDHSVMGKAAELAYYLLFSFLPLIIFATALLGLLNLNTSEILVSDTISNLIPQDVLNLVSSFYDYIKGDQNITMMYTGLGLSIYFASAAVRSLIRSLDVAYNVKKGRNPILQFILSLFFSVIFLATIVLSMLLMVAGGYLIDVAVRLIPPLNEVQWIINILRFAVMIFPIFGILSLLYLFTPHRKVKVRNALPGALFSTLMWVVVSMIFSFYVSNFGRYSVLYGSLGAILVLMLWLYITGLIFILGGELNGALLERQRYLQEQKMLDDGELIRPVENEEE
ncbi:MAG: YihY/virulence factor BrkB family protein [Oscillospiraceae bacterium]|nr:YihY/virulence factor BrkB family protein [Oscillospiraceae bacterium]